ncbi:MAG TPA: hypothetical protein DDZ51_22745 [Planctomycetaceae bacterium]|nr:hypothetical protein [Planctomycetaceae bacterium]
MSGLLLQWACFSLVSAQEGDTQITERAVRSAVVPRLIVVLRATNEVKMTKPLLADLLEQGMVKSGCRCTGEPKVSEIAPSFYASLDRLVKEVETAAIDDDSSQGRGDGVIMIRDYDPRQKFPHVYELTLAEPEKFLKTLKVSYQDGQTEELSDSDAGRLDALGVDQKGQNSYRIRLPEHPESYELLAGQLQAEDKTYKGPWPNTASHFSVTFTDFQGSLESLSLALTERGINEISSPLAFFDEETDTRFVVAGIGFDRLSPYGPQVNNILEIAVAPLSQGVNKVWVKLPLTADQLEEEMASWKAVQTGKDAIERMRKDGWDDQDDLQEVALSETAQPRWFQLQPNAELHRRNFPLTGLPALKQKFPTMHMIVVHQNNDRAVFSVDGAGNPVFGHAEEIKDPDILAGDRAELDENE